MNSKLRKALDDYKQAITDDSGTAWQQEESITEAEKAIRRAVGEEMLALKPGVALAEPLASDKEWAEYEGYNKALDDWEQNIKQWQGFHHTCCDMCQQLRQKIKQWQGGVI